MVKAMVSNFDRRIPQGTDTVFEKDMGVTIGVDANGNATSWLRAAFDSTGRLKSAFPIPK
jgi:hypothetical protein